MKKYLKSSLFILFFGLQTAHAQVAENSKLFKEIIALDSQIFEQGFNQCIPGIIEKYTADNLEFMHDTGGMQNRDEFLQAIKTNICSKPDGKPIRTLLTGSTKIFPLENNGVLYGAIQQGEHHFHTKGNDSAIEGYTIAKFTHVWLLQNGQWKLKTSLSFDHQKINGRAASNSLIQKMMVPPIKLFQLTIASYTWSLFFQDQNK